MSVQLHFIISSEQIAQVLKRILKGFETSANRTFLLDSFLNYDGTNSYGSEHVFFLSFRHRYLSIRRFRAIYQIVVHFSSAMAFLLFSPRRSFSYLFPSFEQAQSLSRNRIISLLSGSKAEIAAGLLTRP